MPLHPLLDLLFLLIKVAFVGAFVVVGFPIAVSDSQSVGLAWVDASGIVLGLWPFLFDLVGQADFELSGVEGDVDGFGLAVSRQAFVCPEFQGG